jgi:hypothetical protein
MKKMCVMLAIAICFGFAGCKKSSPATPKPKPAQQAVKPTKTAAEQAAPAMQQMAGEAQKSAEETTEKAAEEAKGAAEEGKEAMIMEAAEVDLTSTIDKLKEQAKSMNIDALKATAEKYKAQYLSMKNDLTTKKDQLAKLTEAGKTGAEVLGLSKDVENLTATLSSLKERMMVYVDALKAQGVDISSFTVE